MLTFAVAIFFVLITPGPGVLSIAGVGSAFGYRQGWAYGSGLFVGSNLVMLATVLGLAAFLEANPSLRIVFMIVSGLYLLYIAARVALAGSKIAFIEQADPPGFWGAIVLQVFNPKAYAVGTFTFSNFPFWPDSFWVETGLKLLILNAVWIPIHILWLWAGVTMRRLELSQPTQRAINMAMALAMVTVVMIAFWSSFASA